MKTLPNPPRVSFISDGVHYASQKCAVLAVRGTGLDPKQWLMKALHGKYIVITSRFSFAKMGTETTHEIVTPEAAVTFWNGCEVADKLPCSIAFPRFRAKAA